MESLILKTLDVNVILHDSKALKLLIKYSQGSPIYVGSLIKEMIYNGIRRLSETYLKENAERNGRIRYNDFTAFSKSETNIGMAGYIL